MTDDVDLGWFYGEFPLVEEEFGRALDESLEPRSRDQLFDLVARERGPGWTHAADVGCGEGGATLRLAVDFELMVVGIDPVDRHLELSQRLADDAGIGARTWFVSGRAEALPLADTSVDLVFCRDVLSHVTELDHAYGEFARVLRPGGIAIVYQMFGTDRLETSEASWLWQTMCVVPSSADVSSTEAAIDASPLDVVEHLHVGTEWGEWSEEATGSSSRRMLHTARLLREPDRYIQQFGRVAYDGMLGDCLWSVYGMIGKLARQVFVLRKP